MKKEEILKRHTELGAGCKVEYNITHDSIIKAMQDYADQETSAIRQELQEVKQLAIYHEDRFNSCEKLKDDYWAQLQKEKFWKEKFEKATIDRDITIVDLSARVRDLEELLETYKEINGSNAKINEHRNELLVFLGDLSCNRTIPVEIRNKINLLTSPQGDNK